MSDVTELAARAARAEMERDAALERARRAEVALGVMARRMSEPEEFAKTMTLCGIPATDLRDIYKVIYEWQRAGGTPTLLERYQELWDLRSQVEEKA